MKYILDFDEVIFDTKALKAKMDEMNISQADRNNNLFHRIAEEDPSFNVKDFVFPDALVFLQEYGDQCIVVSSASSRKEENNINTALQTEFQKNKISLSGVADLVSEVCVVSSEKTEALQEIQSDLGEDVLFLDDREVYIRQAQEIGMRSVWMDREGKGNATSPEGVPAMKEFPRVASFSEFAQYIESCKKKKI